MIKLVDHSFKWYKKDNISVIEYAFNEEEFKYTSFVTGGDTLIKNLKSVQGGEFITINKYNYEVLKNTYYEFAHKEYLDIDKSELIKTIH